MVTKNWPILLLTWSAGSLDALSYLGLGHTFTANMTGNTALFGLALAQGNWLDVLHTLTAILGFVLGAMGGTFLIERNYEQHSRIWTPRNTRMLIIEGCLLLVFAISWPFAASLPKGNLVVYGLLIVSALAMGQQSAFVLSLDVTGISTTYITGTITTLMANLGRRLFTHTQESPARATAIENKIDRQQRPLRLAAVWLIYIVAALVSGVAALHVATFAAFLPLLAIVIAIVYAIISQRKQKGSR